MGLGREVSAPRPPMCGEEGRWVTGINGTSSRDVGPGGTGRRKAVLPDCGGPAWGSAVPSCPLTDAASPWDLKRAPGALTSSRVSQLTQTGEGCGQEEARVSARPSLL